MKRSVLVIFGGISSEHEISCISAANVIDNLDRAKYIVKKIGIDKTGTWYYYEGNVHHIRNGVWNNDIINKKAVTNVKKELKKYEVVFPVLHGKYGEDGAIQGLLEISRVKYVGCKVLGSSIAMDKVLSKELVNDLGIDIVPYISLKYNEFFRQHFNYDEFINNVQKKIGFPLIIKPSREGSSYGVCKVENIEKIFGAIDYAFRFDKEILIEKYIRPRKEVECAVLENVEKSESYISTPGQILISNEFYDFNAKYENIKSDFKIPADISKEQIEKIKEYSKMIFGKLRLSSLARIDFFVSGNKIYFNEVNTMPGFTNRSMYPMLLKADGINYKMLLDILILNALKEK